MPTTCNRVGLSPNAFKIRYRIPSRTCTIINTTRRSSTLPSHEAYVIDPGQYRPISVPRGPSQGWAVSSKQTVVPSVHKKTRALERNGKGSHALVLANIPRNSVNASQERTGSRKIEQQKLDVNSVESWEELFLDMRRTEPDTGLWDSFLFMQQTERLRLLSEPSAEYLRDLILEAAIADGSRIPQLLRAADTLKDETGYAWDHLYAKCLHGLLIRQDYLSASYVHFHLYPSSPPDHHIFGTLLSSFVVNRSPQMQSFLNMVYISSQQRGVYDHIIPALFHAGQSKTARHWRKELLKHQDLPSIKNNKSRPFLNFLALYFPLLQLSEGEIKVINGSAASREQASKDPAMDRDLVPQKGFLGDATVARWFASSWASLEFTINLLGRAGLGEIGPLALQSLALREDDALGVRNRLGQLERLGVPISQTTYCALVVTFAENGDQDSLSTLLHCDVHPDEFDDAETREMLLMEARRKGDGNMEKLFQKIERTIQNRLPQRLSSILQHDNEKAAPIPPITPETMLTTIQSVAKTRESTMLLQKAFRGINIHPATSRPSRKHKVDKAIHALRQTAANDGIVARAYWEVLINNLGRSGRFEELERVCMEIIDMYHPKYGGVIPVHLDDWPSIPRRLLISPPETVKRPSSTSSKRTKATGQQMDENQPPHRPNQISQQTFFLENMGEGYDLGPLNDPLQASEMIYIPADLPFSHRAHPVQKIFNPKLQRAIVRWGFDHSLEDKFNPSDITRKSTILSYDIAKGVRLLAILRDEGVIIDRQVLLSGLKARLALSRIPGRTKARARDSNETSMRVMKRLIDDAWGEEILPALPELLGELDREIVKRRKHDPRLSRRMLIPREVEVIPV